MKRLGLYFSGTGNTKFCVRQFAQALGEEYAFCSIEEAGAAKQIQEAEEIMIGYPIYYSDLPLIVKDFINHNNRLWNNKKIFIIATMGLFSGDGCGCSARLLKKYGAEITGGLHLKMPDNTIDVNLLKKSPLGEQKLIEQSIGKIRTSARLYQSGRPPLDGLSFVSEAAGFLGQRLWFGKMTASYKNLPRVNTEKCTGCNSCVKVCPMNNLHLTNDGIIRQTGSCTLCYRCVHTCPSQALSILGRNVVHAPSLLLKDDKPADDNPAARAH